MPGTLAISPGQTLASSLLRKIGWPSAACRAAVLLFVRGPWCPVCRRQITRFADRADEFAAFGVPVIVVSTARPGSYSADARLGGLTMRYLTDFDGAIITELGIAAEHPDHGVISRPATVIIDPAGVIRYAHVGTHPRDRPEPAAILLAVRHMLAIA